MKRSPDRMLAEGLARWVEMMRRHAGLVVLLVALASSAVAVYTATHLGVNADLDAMFSQELPHRVLELQYEKTFPMMAETVLLVIDAEIPERARLAASALARRMRESPGLFRSVYVPAGPFFEEHALLYMSVDELEDFADRLARVQPYLAGLARDGTLRGLAMLLERGVAAVREGEIVGDELVPIFDRLARATRAVLDGRRYSVSWAEVVAGHELDIDARRRFIVAQPVLDYSDLVAGRRPLGALRRFTHELGLDEAHGVRVRITGDIALSYEEMQLVQKQATIAGISSFVMVSALLLLALRYTRLVVATLATLLVGLVWTSGFAALAIGHLNMISVAFAVLFIGLAVDFGIHFCMRYEELLERGFKHPAALAETARGVGTSILLCAATTAVGFYAFVPTDFAGVAELGLIAGTGMFISVACSFTLLPALMSLRPLKRRATAKRAALLRLPSIPAVATGHPRAVAVASLAVAVWGFALLPHVYFDRNPLRVRDPQAESVQVFEELLSNGGSSPWDVSVVAPDLKTAETLAAKLRQLDVVDRAVTISDFVPGDQDEKLSIMEDVSLFLPPSGSVEPTAGPAKLDEQLDAVASLEKEIERLLDDGTTAELAASSRRVEAALAELSKRVHASSQAASLIANLEKSLLGSLPEELRILKKAINAGPVTLENLPAGLLERMVAPDGMVRVEVSPRNDLRDNTALAHFVEQVRSLAPEATGPAVGIYEQSRATVRALRQALVSAVVVITIVLLLIWRTLGDTLLVMTPLGLAALLTAAATVLFDVPFNFADVIVIPLLLGMGVDSGIHLVHRSRTSQAEREHLLDTSTARAVLFSSLTTIASFATLGFASHRGIASLGRLLAIGIALALICNLFVLPALIELRTRRAASHGSRAGPKSSP